MEKNKPAFHLAARLFTISALFFAIPLIIFGWILYQNDIKSEKEIVHLQVQLELERGIDEISKNIEEDRLVLVNIIHQADPHSSADLRSLTPKGHEVFAFRKKGAYWTQSASSTGESIGSLPHKLLERIEAGNGLTSAIGSNLAIAETEIDTILIMLEPIDTFLKDTIKPDARYPLEFSLRPLLQMPKDKIVYKKSVPRTSLYLTGALPKATYKHAVQSSFVYYTGWVALGTLLLFAAMAFFVYRRLSQPFTRFISAMDALAKGDFTIRIPEDGKGLEINGLAQTFNTTLDQLQATIAEEKKTRMDKERLTRELEWARQIQKELLPPSLPQIEPIEIATHFSPALEVSGDFFDLFHSDGRLILMMADSSGKGLGPALFSLGLRGALRALLASRDNFTEKLCQTNTLFCADSKESGMFATAFVAEIDLASFTMTYINAGHLPAILKEEEKEYSLDKNAPAFGLPWEGVQAKTIELSHNSLFALFTDGLTEQPGENGDEIPIENIHKSLTLCKNADENVKELLELQIKHQGKAERLDDIALIVIKRP